MSFRVSLAHAVCAFWVVGGVPPDDPDESLLEQAAMAPTKNASPTRNLVMGITSEALRGKQGPGFSELPRT
jgi:hypothetical protein